MKLLLSEILIILCNLWRKLWQSWFIHRLSKLLIWLINNLSISIMLLLKLQICIQRLISINTVPYFYIESIALLCFLIIHSYFEKPFHWFHFSCILICKIYGFYQRDWENSLIIYGSKFWKFSDLWTSSYNFNLWLLVINLIVWLKFSSWLL